MHIERIPGRKPMELYVLRKLAKPNPELWDFAAELIIQSKKTPESVKRARREARAKIAEKATTYMTDTEDRPIGS